MNLQGMLIAPWYATRRVTRWIMLLLCLFMLAGGIALVKFGMRGEAHVFWAPVVGMFAAAGVFALTLAVLSPCLLLAIDARQMRLPRLERDAVGAVLLYSALLIVGPGLLIGLPGGYLLNVMGALAAACSAAIAITLLPRMLSFFVWMLPAAFNILQPTFDLPRPVDPGFPLFCAALTLCFGALSLVFWRRIIRSPNPYTANLGGPMLIQFHSVNRGGWGSWGGTGMDPSTMIRRNPAWLQPSVAVNHSGPAHPVTSLRIGLGGLFAPLTARGRLQQMSLVVGVSLIFIAQMGMQNARRHPGNFSESFIHSGLLGMMMWGVGFGGTMMAIVPVAQLVQRWVKQNAELPLFALLPGLGDARQVKRRLLCAALLPPAMAMGGLMLLTLVAAVLLHASTFAIIGLLFALGGSIAFLSAFVVSVIGGKPLGRWSSIGLCLLGYGLFCFSILVPLIDAADLAQRYVYVFAGAWALLLALLGWLARRGWRGLESRPHPFLANRA